MFFFKLEDTEFALLSRILMRSTEIWLVCYLHLGIRHNALGGPVQCLCHFPLLPFYSRLYCLEVYIYLWQVFLPLIGSESYEKMVIDECEGIFC